MLTLENKLWLEQAAQKVGTKPDSLINGILHQIRTELGSITKKEDLLDWMNRSRHLETNLGETLFSAESTLRAVEETVKATQLYLNQTQMLSNKLKK
jgi:hypothetical protein